MIGYVTSWSSRRFIASTPGTTVRLPIVAVSPGETPESITETIESTYNSTTRVGKDTNAYRGRVQVIQTPTLHSDEDPGTFGYFADGVEVLSGSFTCDPSICLQTGVAYACATTTEIFGTSSYGISFIMVSPVFSGRSFDAHAYVCTTCDGGAGDGGDADYLVTQYLLYGNYQSVVVGRPRDIPVGRKWRFTRDEALYALDRLISAHYTKCSEIDHDPYYQTYAGLLCRPFRSTWKFDVADYRDRALRALAFVENDELEENDRDVWGRLSCAVIAAYKAADVDNIENLTQLGQFGDTLKTYMSPIDCTAEGLAEAASGRLLSAKYGDALTIKDAAELQRGYWRLISGTWTEGDQTRRAADTLNHLGIDYRFNLQCSARRNGDAISRTIMFAADHGFYPGLSTIWNLVPYSFVVDWFLNVQEIMASRDMRVLMNVLDVRRVFMSTRREYTTSFGKCEFHVSTWSRTCATDLPIPDVNLHASMASLNQLITGAALLVQQIL